MRLAKHSPLRERRPDTIILSADTLVSLEGEIIGKPANMKQARTFLRRLSGRTHEVCTAVVIARARRRFISFTEISRVEIPPIHIDGAIDVYLARINPLDKAGAYAAQGVGGEIIASHRRLGHKRHRSADGTHIGSAENSEYTARKRAFTLRRFHCHLCRRDRNMCRFASQDAIKEPNNEAVGQQNNRNTKTRPDKKVTHFQRNQRRRRDDHEKFRPAFLEINANAFREQDRRIKQCDHRRRLQRPTLQSPPEDV